MRWSYTDRHKNSVYSTYSAGLHTTEGLQLSTWLQMSYVEGLLPYHGKCRDSSLNPKFYHLNLNSNVSEIDTFVGYIFESLLAPAPASIFIQSL
jgi:hypothetical protein